MTHAKLQSYADTCASSFPLILCFGREPNTDLAIAGTHGLYDFDGPRGSTCAFWNISYGIMSATVDLTTAKLKTACRTRTSSPLIYADSLPIGLLNSERKKKRHRQIDPARIDAHVAEVFGFAPLLSRVQLVFMSGLEASDFEYSRGTIRDHCREHTIDVVQVPFFFGNNAPRIRAVVVGKVYERVQSVMETFLSPW